MEIDKHDIYDTNRFSNVLSDLFPVHFFMGGEINEHDREFESLGIDGDVLKI